MINLRTRKAKLRYHAEINKLIIVLSLLQAKQLKPIFDKQLEGVAKNIKGIDGVVNAQTSKLRRIFRLHYARVGDIFSKRVFKLFEKEGIVPEQKGLADEFWVGMNQWIDTQTASQVTLIQDTTKQKLKKIVKDGVADGLSSIQIARKIRDKKQFSFYRAKVIARTETHNAAIFGQDKSIDVVSRTNKIEFWREWINAGDLRVRGKGKDKFNHIIANGQKRKQGKAFLVSSERLMHPGDSLLGASAGNIVLCRCVLGYKMIRKRKQRGI